MRPSVRLLVVFAIALCTNAGAQSVLTLAPDGGPPIQFVAPLGIDPPSGGTAAFRVVAHIPVGVHDELTKVGRELRLEIVSELVPQVDAPQMPAGRPRSAITVRMSLPYPVSAHARLRLQKGANKMISPVIVAIADPRASVHYTWPAGVDKRAAGCYNCDRPERLRGKTEADGVYEIFTNGRHLAVRPTTKNRFAVSPSAVDHSTS